MCVYIVKLAAMWFVYQYNDCLHQVSLLHSLQTAHNVVHWCIADDSASESHVIHFHKQLIVLYTDGLTLMRCYVTIVSMCSRRHLTVDP